MRQGDQLEHTIPWGFVLPEAESGVRLRPPFDSEDITDDLRERIPRSERTAVMDGAPTRPTSSLPPPAHSGVFMPPTSRMSSVPPPPIVPRPMSALVAPSAPPAMHPSILPAVQALMVATACGWIVPPSAARAGEVRSSSSALGWRLYVLFTTAMMAALATSVLFLTGHASAMSKAPAPVLAPVITVNVPAPVVTAPAVTAPAPVAPVVVAPKAPARVASVRVAAPAAKPVLSAAPAPNAAPPSPPSPPPASSQAQETADMLREQLGAAVH